MNKIKLIAIAVIIMVVGPTKIFAQAKKNSPQSNHGGVIQKAGDYHIEMVKAVDKFGFYLFDANMKALSNKDISGKVVFQYPDKTSSSSTLMANGDDGFTAKNDNEKKFTSCVVSLKVKGKTVSSTFSSIKDPVQKPKPHGHSHDGDDHQH